MKLKRIVWKDQEKKLEIKVIRIKLKKKISQIEIKGEIENKQNFYKSAKKKI